MRRERALLRGVLVAATAFLVVLLPPPLHAPAPAPPAVRDDGRPPAPQADRFDRVLRDAARRTAEHEKARDRADRLRREVERLRAEAKAGEGAGAEERAGRVTQADVERAVAELRSAERRRKGIRDRLWRELEEAQPGFATAGPDGCDLGRRSKPPRKRPAGWVSPAQGHRMTAGWAARGERWRSRHTGQDFAVRAGTPVRAVGPGTVRVIACGDAYGNQVLVRHADGYFTQYAHLSRIDVRPGQRVEAGQRLGTAGATGNATGPHLHFEVRVTPYLGSAVPPLPWLRRHGVPLKLKKG
ncbi:MULTISPECIES: M23 family metallopeptidase [Streptomyces]|uniref:M23 family peptidase n=2 Tax=Streptomyces TaxID=1883 RepID=A0A2U9P5P9_STRAS|nr:peptidoglycan DD-metalloendopeptidase family protein [Streptomyces actuosus]AWT44415.1 M23 family peptidase [Streptomyces actuosus]MBM4820406.1 M23 family metallopeptidase [Streptomyces actuosus]